MSKASDLSTSLPSILPAIGSYQTLLKAMYSLRHQSLSAQEPYVLLQMEHRQAACKASALLSVHIFDLEAKFLNLKIKK